MTLVIFIIYVITIIKGLWEYNHVKRMWRLWSFWQSMKLFQETELIRDNLLQYTFTLRRCLEHLTGDGSDTTAIAGRDCLKMVEQLHGGLVQLSDRLFPAYVYDSLPLAIQATVESWLRSYPYLQISLEIPAVWRKESLEESLIIIRTLEELLRIAVSTNTSISSSLQPLKSVAIALKSLDSQAVLEVKLGFHSLQDNANNSNTLEVRYLCNSFQYLTTGKCSFHYHEQDLTWHLVW